MSMPTHSAPKLCAVGVDCLYLGSSDDGFRIEWDTAEKTRRRELGL